MGMGEPLLNLDAVLEAAAVLTDPARFGLGARHVTISTSGVVPGIERLTRLASPVDPGRSASTPARDPLRDLLVPLNRRWPVAEVVAAARAYGRDDRPAGELRVRDDRRDQRHGRRRRRRRRASCAASGAHVNCIPMNPVAHTPWSASAAGADRGVRGPPARGGDRGHDPAQPRPGGRGRLRSAGRRAGRRAGAAPVVARRRERLVAASAAALRGERSAEPPPPGVGRARPHRPASAARRPHPGCRPAVLGPPAAGPPPDHPREGAADGRGRALIAASILNADLANLAREVRRAVEGRRRPDPPRRDGRPLRAEPDLRLDDDRPRSGR